MSKRFLTAGMLITLICLPSFAQHDLTMKSTNLNPQGYKPGGVVVIPVVVDYAGTESVEYTSDVLLPEYWRLISGKGTITFQSQGSDLLLAAFNVPAMTEAGDYSVIIRLEASDGSLSEMTIPVKVLQIQSLKCAMMMQPDYVLAGAAYRVVFACSNNGNVRTKANLEVLSDGGFDFRTEAVRLDLSPGQTREVAVIVDTPISLYMQMKHSVRMVMYAEGNTSVKASAVSLVDIIPRTSGRESRYNTIQGEVSTLGILQHSPETDVFGLKTEMTARGFLDEDQSTFLYFKAAKPMAGINTLVPDREEYILRVDGGEYSVGMGTQFFTLSTLTEASVYGTGVSLSRSFGDLETSGFVMDTLLDRRNESEFGGKLLYRFNDRGTAAFNILQANDNGIWTNAGVEGHFLTSSRGRLEWEYAVSTESRSDESLYVSLGDTGERASYFLKYLYAGPAYRGTFSDISQLTANLSYKPLDAVRLRAVLGSKEYDLDSPIPGKLTSAQLGLSWMGIDSTTIFADVFRTFQQELSESPSDRVNREIYRIGFIRHGGPVKLGLNYEFGSRLSFEDSLRRFTERFIASLDVTGQVLGDVGIVLGHYLRDPESTKTPYSDITIRWERPLTGRMDLSAAYRTVNSQQSYYLGADNFSLELDVDFPSQSEMTVRAEYGPNRLTGDPEELKISMLFSIPFLLPVSVKRNIGRIEGQVLDAENGEALQDVVLRLGDSVAATDPFGKYVFHSLSRGVHRLYLDPASLPAGYLPDENIPLEIAVSDGITEKDIKVTRAAGITGKVVLYRFDRNYQRLAGEEGAAYVDPQGIDGVLLTAQGHGIVRRALSDEEGNFAFPPLRPGTWTLLVPRDILPEGHFFAKGEFVFELEPGQKEDVIIKIFPKIRPIRFIDQGTITEEAGLPEGAESVPDEEGYIHTETER